MSILALQLGAQLVSAGLSFKQAADEKRLMQQANKAAAKKMLEARGKLGVNEFEAIDINKEIYELEREQMLTLGANALQMGVEGDPRGGAAMAGRAMLANNQGAARIRTAMAQDQRNIDKMVAQQGARNREMGIGLDLAEVEGAQEASALHQTNRNAAITQGMSAVTGAAKTVYESEPLYKRQRGVGGTDPAQPTGQGSSQFYNNPFDIYSIPSGDSDLYTPQRMGFVDPAYGFGGGTTFKPFG